MKRTIISIIGVALCAAIAGAKEPAGTLTRFRGEEFAKVMNYTSSDIEYIPGSPRVEIIGCKEARESIMLMSQGETLMIHASENSYEKEPAIIKVYGHKVESIMLFGSGDGKVDVLSGSNSTLALYGSGDMTAGNVRGNVVTLLVFGSGDMIVGTAEASSATKVNVGGSGDILVRKMNSRSVEANVMGSGDLNINLVNTTTLRAVVMGSGDITLAGTCTNASLMCQGSGTINARGLKATKVSKIIQGSGDIHN